MGSIRDLAERESWDLDRARAFRVFFAKVILHFISSPKRPILPLSRVSRILTDCLALYPQDFEGSKFPNLDLSFPAPSPLSPSPRHVDLGLIDRIASPSFRLSLIPASSTTYTTYEGHEVLPNAQAAETCTIFFGRQPRIHLDSATLTSAFSHLRRSPHTL